MVALRAEWKSRNRLAWCKDRSDWPDVGPGESAGANELVGTGLDLGLEIPGAMMCPPAGHCTVVKYLEVRRHLIDNSSYETVLLIWGCGPWCGLSSVPGGMSCLQAASACALRSLISD